MKLVTGTLKLKSQWINIIGIHIEKISLNKTGNVVQPVSTTDTGQYGWFWTGGVCPYIDITFFDGQAAGAGTDFSTDDSVLTGDPVFAIVDTSVLHLGGGDGSQTDIGISMKTIKHVLLESKDTKQLQRKVNKLTGAFYDLVGSEFIT